jgi:hypothetical protein
MTANSGTMLVARPHQLKLGGILSGARQADPSPIRGSPARSVVKLNQGEWLGAAGFAHNVPELVEFFPGVATIISTRYAHTAGRTGLAACRHRYTKPVQDRKDIFAVEHYNRDASGWQL